MQGQIDELVDALSAADAAEKMRLAGAVEGEGSA
jgi:hypothetical protein